MYRLRNTFTRSRTPTADELKTQSSLEVPKQIRSASFDEIQLEAQRSHQKGSNQLLLPPVSADERQPSRGLLHVPQLGPGPSSGQRSRSFDLTGSTFESGDGGSPTVVSAFLDVPKRFQRRRSSQKVPPVLCVHCMYLEEYLQMRHHTDTTTSPDETLQLSTGHCWRDWVAGEDDDDDDGGGDGGDDGDGDGDDNDDEAVDDEEEAEGEEAEPEDDGEYDGEDDGGEEDGDDDDGCGDERYLGQAPVPVPGKQHGDWEDDDEEEEEAAEGPNDEDAEDGCSARSTYRRHTASELYRTEHSAETPPSVLLSDYARLFPRVSQRSVQLSVDTGGDDAVVVVPATPCAITVTLPPVAQPAEPDQIPDLRTVAAPRPHLSAVVLSVIAVTPAVSNVRGGSAQDDAGVPEATEVDDASSQATRTRRRSISRQEAIVIETEAGLAVATQGGPPVITTSEEPPPRAASSDSNSNEPLASDAAATPDNDKTRPARRPVPPPPPLPPSRPLPPAPPLSPPPLPDVCVCGSEPLAPAAPAEPEPPDAVHNIYLQVPDLRRDRAASVDSCFAKVKSAKTEELQSPNGDLTLLTVSGAGPGTLAGTGAIRSRSVDIVLPTKEQARYKALALTDANAAGNSGAGGADGDGGMFVQLVNSAGKDGSGFEQRYRIRCTPDWSDRAVVGEHLWAPTAVSGDWCYVGDSDCLKTGPRIKCAACKITSHLTCLGLLLERSLLCKPTFRHEGVPLDATGIGTKLFHHWVHRRTGKGKCGQCGKSLQAKLSFSSTKEIVALSCTWCKSSYHNKEACFHASHIVEECSLGEHGKIIVPPYWIVKLTSPGGSRDSKRAPKVTRATPSKGGKVPAARKAPAPPHESRTSFVVQPLPMAKLTPVLVFINPKSGGNQGSKLIQKFQWLLNPRQVFDLSQGGPRMGLELFRRVPLLRVLACGGDGTVGWVLSVLDQLNFVPPAAVGVLPLGTGNDLARALGWGGGYTDEPIGKVLTNVETSEPVLLDRWMLRVVPNTTRPETGTSGAGDTGKDNLPLNVVNNYFSLGVDAHIALEFHEAREAHPEKFNSRLRNKMFYGQAGGKDLLKRKWKGLAEFVTLDCDGKDLTPKLKEHKVHAIVFLNIPSYGGGTHPWNKSGGQYEPAIDDGMIEVVGLTTYQLPLLQAGGHGTCIAQCRTAKIVTSKSIPMQVDGEACKLKPSIIELTLLNKAVMLAKKKSGKANVSQDKIESLSVNLMKIMMRDYEQHHYDKERLRQSAVCLGCLETRIVDLEQLRALINKYYGEHSDRPKLSPDWCFIDACTAQRFYRIDRAQENLHFITDIVTDCLFLLDQEQPLVRTDAEDRPSAPSPSLSLPRPDSAVVRDCSAVATSYPKIPTLNRSLSGPPGSETFSFPAVRPLARKNSQEAVLTTVRATPVEVDKHEIATKKNLQLNPRSEAHHVA